MSEETLVNLDHELKESAADVAWRQWGVLASLPPIAGKPPASSLVDPEALVLLSLALRDYERRLWDVLTWWAETGARLLSLQRFRRLLADYPQVVHERAREFAWYAYRRGGQGRWRSVADSDDDMSPGPQPRVGKEFGKSPGLTEPPALVLRLRAAFGVGAKSDTLGFLLGAGAAWSSVRDIAAATYYTPRAISTAADDMALARLIQATRNRPVEYRVEPDRWAQLLGIHQLSGWRFWQPLYAFVAHALAWIESSESLMANEYLLSTGARDLALHHWAAFSRNRIDVPRPEDYPGETYLEAFADTVGRTARWMVSNV